MNLSHRTLANEILDLCDATEEQKQQFLEYIFKNQKPKFFKDMEGKKRFANLPIYRAVCDIIQRRKFRLPDSSCS